MQTIMIEEIKTMAVTQKAALYQMLSEDEELNRYLISGEELFEELESRDKAFSKGEVNMTDRQTLTARLQNRRNEL